MHGSWFSGERPFTGQGAAPPAERELSGETSGNRCRTGNAGIGTPADTAGSARRFLRSGSLRVYASESEKLVANWKADWPFPEIRLIGERWAEPDMEDVFTAYSQRYDELLTKI